MTYFSPRPVSASYFALFVLIVFSSASALAQRQDIPFENNFPAQPMGLFSPHIGDGPWEYPTAEGMDIKASLLARIPYPMSLVFIGTSDILVATRKGEIHRVKDRVLQEDTVKGGPETVFANESGMPGTVHGYIDIVLHPDFTNNKYIYLSYTKAQAGDKKSVAIGRAVWNGQSLENFTELKVIDTGMAYAGRLTFGHDNSLFVTSAGQDPQSLSDLGGKVLRINDDGSTPNDNPFVKQSAHPEIYSYGHRIGLGLTTHPVTGDIWQNENGPFGGDEINLIKPGLNYGWPIESYGRTYQGPWQAKNGRPSHEIFEPPVVFWMPAVAPSGMAFYQGTKLHAWKGDLFVGSLREGSIPGTGHLERIVINENYQEVRRESLLTNLGQRIRDVRQGPDELLYLVTEEKDGALIVIEPAK